MSVSVAQKNNYLFLFQVCLSGQDHHHRNHHHYQLEIRPSYVVLRRHHDPDHFSEVIFWARHFMVLSQRTSGNKTGDWKHLNHLAITSCLIIRLWMHAKLFPKRFSDDFPSDESRQNIVLQIEMPFIWAIESEFFSIAITCCATNIGQHRDTLK